MPFDKAATAVFRIGPTEAHQAAVARTWFGSLLGQSVVLLGLLLAYVAGVALLWRTLGETLADLERSLGAFGFWAVMLTPLLFICVFSLAPTATRAARERRLRPLAENAEPPAPGYFRLHPYGAGDRGGYVRRDDLLDRFVSGMLEAEASVFYLSGASGVGKSSLVASEIVPAFEARGWRVRDARGLGDSYASMAAAIGDLETQLGQPAAPAGRTPAAAQGGEALFERTVIASRALAERGLATGVLLVVDQFEEFLILEDEPQRAAFAGLLRHFAETPVPGVKLLLVFREDYRALLFKQRLPDFIPGRTGFELAPFTRAEAQRFLEGGPKLMDAAGYDALFTGLDRVEQTRGLYRPITLNMVGLVLERTGSRLSDDPGRLIERYLADCLTRGRSRDFSGPVLRSMITSAGTKEPRAAPALAEKTRLAEWRVRATLVDLEQDGLVRPLPRDGLWEVSHDFLARLLASVLGRLRPPRFARAAPWALGLAALGWAGALGLGAPYYFSLQREAALAAIRERGFDRLAQVERGIGFRGWGTSDGDLAALSEAAEAEGLQVTVLDLRGSGVTDLSPLEGMPLTTLDLSFAGGVTDLSPLDGMPLTSLDLSYALGVTDLSPLEGMPLTSLDLSAAVGVTDLSPLEGMPLTSLSLS